MRIEIPEFALVLLIGAPSSGKTTFAKKHFLKTEILSSDFFRGMVSDNESDQSVTEEAFDLLYYAAGKRLSLKRTTVIDATNTRKSDRKKLLELAKSHDVHAAAIVLELPEATLLERTAARADREISPRVVKKYAEEVARSVKGLRKEGFRFVYVLDSEEEIAQAEIVRTKLWSNRKKETGPFDIIGDVHGCYEELTELLEVLGYVKNGNGIYAHPEGRKAIFLGDLCDRGPRNVDCLRLVMDMEKGGFALCVPGNHDEKLLRWLRGNKVQTTNGLQNTIEELEAAPDAFRKEAKVFLDSLVSHYVLDGGKLVVSHAGLKEEYIGRASMRVREFCLYGDVTGEKDEYGLPVRLDWAESYRGKAIIVYGHTPQPEVLAVNKTYCVDTGCVFGGKLTALRYPELETVSVSAKKEYYTPVRPLAPVPEIASDVLNLRDFVGKLRIETALLPSIPIPEEQTAAALEGMSRFAVDPRWLIYLPPTMSPCQTSPLPDYLEHPAEAFEYYRKNGVQKVICEKKHMGSRAVIVLCRTKEAAEKRFGVKNGERGIIYTRTGRRFFPEKSVETEILDRLDAALEASGFWRDFHTDWVCLDTEFLPWSEKARQLLKEQYAPVGRSGHDALTAAISTIQQARENRSERKLPASEKDVDLRALLTRYEERLEAINLYREAYRVYCWTVRGVDDLRVAPFHLLACEGQVFFDKPHVWHLETIKKYCTGTDVLFLATEYQEIDTESEESQNAGIAWWLNLTESGGEGMVVKPEHFTEKRGEKLLQPAVKCRGREYLRIIYGPEYLTSEHMGRLKDRALGRKRTLALKEFSLGFEGLRRFVSKEPLSRVHECAFGVLALESEPVDPRL